MTITSTTPKKTRDEDEEIDDGRRRGRCGRTWRSPRSASTGAEKKRVPDTCRCRANELARFLTIGPTLVHAYFSITFSIQYPERGKEIWGTGVGGGGVPPRGGRSSSSPPGGFALSLFLSLSRARVCNTDAAFARVPAACTKRAIYARERRRAHLRPALAHARALFSAG